MHFLQASLDSHRLISRDISVLAQHMSKVCADWTMYAD
jgi:hypothetical protein